MIATTICYRRTKLSKSANSCTNHKATKRSHYHRLFVRPARYLEPTGLCQLDAEAASKCTNQTTFPVKGWADVSTLDPSTSVSIGLPALPVATTAKLEAELITDSDNATELAGLCPVEDTGRTHSVPSDESDQIDEAYPSRLCTSKMRSNRGQSLDMQAPMVRLRTS